MSILYRVRWVFDLASSHVKGALSPQTPLALSSGTTVDLPRIEPPADVGNMPLFLNHGVSPRLRGAYFLTWWYSAPPGQNHSLSFRLVHHQPRYFLAFRCLLALLQPLDWVPNSVASSVPLGRLTRCAPSQSTTYKLAGVPRMAQGESFRAQTKSPPDLRRALKCLGLRGLALATRSSRRRRPRWRAARRRASRTGRA